MRRPDLLPPFAFALCALIWGSTWVWIKVGYAGSGPFSAAALRFFLAAAFLLGAAALLRLALPRGAQWGLVAFVGVAMFTLNYGFVYWGEQWLASGIAGALFGLMPAFTVVLAHVFVPGDRLTPRKVVGVLVGVGGVAVLLGVGSVAYATPLLPALAIVAGALSAAAANVATKLHGGGLHPVVLTGWGQLLGAALLVAWGLLAGEALALPRGAAAWWSVIYLAVVGSVVAFVVWFWLVARWPATRTSLVTLFTPLVAVLLGLLVFQEPLTWNVAVGTACIVAGVKLAA